MLEYAPRNINAHLADKYKHMEKNDLKRQYFIIQSTNIF